MTYPELKIALDIGDPEDILRNLKPRNYYGKYLIVCDEGDIHAFDENGKEHEIDHIPDACFIRACFIREYFLDKIIIPETVTSIGSCAFYDCSDLTSVIISNSVISIKPCAFGECYGLTSVMIGNGVTSIENGAFYSCFRLMDVTIGNGVTNIGYGAFKFCSSLRSLTLPSCMKYIDEDAFCGCTNLERVLFKGKTIEQVKAMENYPWGIEWGIEDESIFQAGT